MKYNQKLIDQLSKGEIAPKPELTLQGLNDRLLAIEEELKNRK